MVKWDSDGTVQSRRGSGRESYKGKSKTEDVSHGKVGLRSSRSKKSGWGGREGVRVELEGTKYCSRSEVRLVQEYGYMKEPPMNIRDYPNMPFFTIPAFHIDRWTDTFMAAHQYTL